jgi:hypothetical protein
MSRFYRKMPIALLLLSLVAAPLIARAEEPAAAETPRQSCFAIRDWNGWKSPQPDQLYFRVRLHDVFLIELNDQNSWLSAPGMHLVTKVHGSDWVCNPIDLDLGLADEHIFREHLFIKSIRKLTDAEVAAIPKEFRP